MVLLLMVVLSSMVVLTCLDLCMVSTSVPWDGKAEWSAWASDVHIKNCWLFKSFRTNRRKNTMDNTQTLPSWAGQKVSRRGPFWGNRSSETFVVSTSLLERVLWQVRSVTPQGVTPRGPGRTPATTPGTTPGTSPGISTPGSRGTPQSPSPSRSPSLSMSKPRGKPKGPKARPREEAGRMDGCLLLC